MMHVIDDCVDEISLEGLDGITIPTLWLRLENRQPTFQLSLDDEVKSYLWSCLCEVEDLDYHVLPKARDDVIIWDRFKENPEENDINFDRQDDRIVDLYPIELIDENGIKGSCPTYKTRKKITNQIRAKDGENMSLREAFEKWGRTLVIVASQEKREQSLLRGVVMKTPLDSRQFAVLERVGRGRWNGEVSHGPKNLLAVVRESRSLFYVRKALQSMQTITVQSFGIRNSQGKMVSSKCVHLVRFGRERKTMAQIRLEALTKLLDSKPDQRALLSEVRDEMGIDVRQFKKLYDFGKKHVESKLVPYIEMYPDAKASEYMYKGGHSERYLRVLHLIKVYNANAEEREEEGDVEEDEEEDNLPCDGTTPFLAQVPRRPRCMELSIIQQGYEVLREEETSGVSEQQMARSLSLAKLEGRTLCRDVSRLKLTVMMMKDVGRCRVRVYICDDLAKSSKLHEQIQEEKSKMLLNLGAEGNSAVLKSLSDSGLHSKKKNPALAKIEGPKAEPKSPLTYRILRRTNIILKHVQENRLIDNMLWLRKKVDEDAQHDTHKFTPFDKKGLWRLLKVLDEEKQIKIVRKKITVGEKTKEAMFVCEPNMPDDDPLVFAAIDAAKMRMVALSKSSRQRMEELSKVQEDDQETPDHNLLRSQVKKAEMIHDSRAGARYGFQSRMNRCKLAHQLLFYQVYDYCTKQEASDTNEQTYMNVDSSYEVTEESVIDDIYDVDRLKVYVADLTFRRFIPPLRKYPGYENGWCLLGDILLHMPVYVFCQIIRVNFKIPALEDFLKHPVRRLVPVSTLPPFIRQQLLYDRKFLHNFFQLCMSLAEMGLLSIGRKNYREKEQVFLYVHRYVTLLDTTDLDIPPSDWPVKHFHLKTFHEVNHYWFTLNYICMNTSDEIVKFSCGVTRFSNPERVARFKRAHVEYTPETIIDDGHLPGDNLGAGGLDSSNWCHLRKNWVKEKNPSDRPLETPLRMMNKPKKRAIKSEEGESPKAQAPPEKKAKTVSKTLKNEEETSPTEKGKRSRKRKASESAALKEKRKDSVDAEVEASGSQAISELEHNVPSTSMDSAIPSTSKIDDATGEIEKIPEKGKVKRPKPYCKVDSVRGAVSEIEKKRREKLAARRRERPEKIRKPRKRRTTVTDVRARKKVVDTKDEEALKRMTKFRVKWTVQEDSCLLLFHVAAKILGGTDRRGTILSGILLRDFMHENFKESLDKTSKACLRRLHYLMKNPATVANVNMYLGDALTDKELMKGVKPQRNFKVCDSGQTNKSIIDLVKKLREKFKDQAVKKRIELPDTLEEINSRFYISQVVETLQCDEPETVEDIEKGVLNHLIHAALLLSEKSNYTPILYNVLETYPEKALLDVLEQMKRNFMITKMKKAKEVTRDSSLPNGNLGIYQLAQRYSYKWISKFPRLLFDDSYEWMRKIVSKETRNLYTPEGPGMAYAEEHGCVAAVLSLVARKKVAFEVILPENILISHPSEVSIRRKMREKEKNQCQKTESDEEEEALIEDLTQKTRNPPLCSRRCISELRFQAQMSARKNMISCPASDYVMVRCAIRLKPLCMAESTSAVQKSAENVYEADQILRQHNNNNTFLHPKTSQWILSQKNGCQSVKLDHDERWELLNSEKLGLTQHQIDICQKIFDQIDDAEDLGVTYVKLWMTHGHTVWFERCLSALVETKLVLSVGVYDRKYVTHVHAHPWLVHSYKNINDKNAASTLELEPEDEEECEEVETETRTKEMLLPKDMWTTKPAPLNLQEVGLLWKGVSVMYEEIPDGAAEEPEEGPVSEEVAEGSKDTSVQETEVSISVQKADVSEKNNEDVAVQGEETEAVMDSQGQHKEVEMDGIVPETEVEDSSVSGHDGATPSTPKKQSVPIDMSGSFILTPPAPGKVLELSFMDGKFVQKVTEKDQVEEPQTAESSTPEKSSNMSTSAGEDTIQTTKEIVRPERSEAAPETVNTSQSALTQPSTGELKSSKKALPNNSPGRSPAKSSKNVKTPPAKLKPETQQITPQVPTTTAASNVEETKTALTEKYSTRMSSEVSTVGNETVPIVTSAVQPSAQPQTSSHMSPSLTPSSQVQSSNKLLSGLKPIATIPLGRHDKPVRFVLPASSLKTLMQSGSTNLYDHIKAITSALQKETTTSSNDNSISTTTQPIMSGATPYLPTISAAPHLAPPIIGQMGMPTFRMNAPLRAPGPRGPGVRVRLPRSYLPSLVPPTAAPTSAGLKVRLPRLGSLKPPDIPKLDDNPLPPPSAPDASQYPDVKSPTGSSSIDAINAVIQNAARAMKSALPSAPSSLLPQQQTSIQVQTATDASATKPGPQIPATSILSPPKKLRQKTSVRKSVEAASKMEQEKVDGSIMNVSQGNAKAATSILPTKTPIQHKLSNTSPEKMISQSASMPQNVITQLAGTSSTSSSSKPPLSTTISAVLVSHFSDSQGLPTTGRVVSVLKPQVISHTIGQKKAPSSSSGPPSTAETLSVGTFPALTKALIVPVTLQPSSSQEQTHLVTCAADHLGISSPSKMKKEVTLPTSASPLRKVKVEPSDSSAVPDVLQTVVSQGDTTFSSDSESIAKKDTGASLSATPTKMKRTRARKPPAKPKPQTTIPKEGVKEETRAKLQSLLSKNLAEKLKPSSSSEETLPDSQSLKPTGVVGATASKTTPTRNSCTRKGSAAPRTRRTVKSPATGPAALEVPVMTSPTASSVPQIAKMFTSSPTHSGSVSQSEPSSTNIISKSATPAVTASESSKLPKKLVSVTHGASPQKPVQSPVARSTHSVYTGATADLVPPGTTTTPVKLQQGKDGSIQDKIKQMLIAGGLAKSDTPIKFNIPTGLNLSGLKFNVVTATEARKMGLFHNKESGEATPQKSSEATPEMTGTSYAAASTKSNIAVFGADNETASAAGKESCQSNQDQDPNEEKLPQYDGAADEPPEPKKKRTEETTEMKKVMKKPEEVGPGASSVEPMELTTSRSTDTTGGEEQVKEGQEDEKQTEANTTSEGDTPRKKRRRRGDPVLTPVEFPSLSFQSLDRVNIIPRPWIKPDGQVNKTALCNMMEAVLMYLMDKPAATFATLTSKYKAVLQPIALLEILETLEKIGCVKIRWITSNRECSLFTSRPEYKRESSGSIQNATFFPDINCPVRMGHFKSLLKPEPSEIPLPLSTQ